MKFIISNDSNDQANFASVQSLALMTKSYNRKISKISTTSFDPCQEEILRLAMKELLFEVKIYWIRLFESNRVQYPPVTVSWVNYVRIPKSSLAFVLIRAETESKYDRKILSMKAPTIAEINSTIHTNSQATLTSLLRSRPVEHQTGPT